MKGSFQSHRLLPGMVPVDSDAARVLFWDPITGFVIFVLR